MRAVPSAHIHRRGFTLVEILVVVAIVAIIVGLLVGTVLMIMGTKDDYQNRKDIGDLEVALEKFKTKYGVYPPSKILLSNDPNQYKTHPLGPQSAKILSGIWRKIDFNTLTVRDQSNNVISEVDWSRGMITGKYAVVLEGDQCLVFFLGGIQSTAQEGKACFGFVDNNANPTDIYNDKWAQVGPFIEFNAARLVQRNLNHPTNPHPFFSYLDAYMGKPYAYFANRSPAGNFYKDDDCAGLGVVKPYFKRTPTFNQYYNPKSFQIISAGRDHVFGEATGPGGSWDPHDPMVTEDGQDDQSNFHPLNLGESKY